MASGLLNVTVIGGSSPNWVLTVTTVGATAIGDHVSATLSGLPVGRGAPFRVTDVPNTVTINVTDDLKPGGGVYGQPAPGPASFYTPTANFKLEQMADKAAYWSESFRRDSAVIDAALNAIQGAIKHYLTEVLLLADPAADGVIGYAEDTDNFWWRRGGVWEPATSELQELATHEALTFPVDYNDVTAADPPAAKVFSRQADITAFLAAAGTSNFKTLQAAWYATPTVLRHNVTFNVAAGVQRPRVAEPNSYAFTLDKRVIVSGSLVIVQGALGSQYRVDVASANVASAVNTPGDPYVEFVGTPFIGRDLRGYFAVFDTGQVVVVHKNTNNRLYLCANTSPIPTSGFVGRPSTILRNSYDDVTAVKNGAVRVETSENNGTTSSIQFYDVALDSFGNYWDLSIWKNMVRGYRMLFDHAGVIDSFGKVFAGNRPIQTWNPAARGHFSYCSVRGSKLAAVPGSNYTGVISFAYTYQSSFQQSYLGGIDYLYVGTCALAYLNRVVLDAFTGSQAIMVYGRSFLYNQDALESAYNGKATVIRNCPGGILVLDKSLFGDNAFNRWLFDGVVGPCVKFQSCSTWGSGPDGIVANEGAPCGNVGVDISDAQCDVPLPANVTVTGALGDVRFSDQILGHTDIKNNGPFVDLNGNRVSHG